MEVRRVDNALRRMSIVQLEASAGNRLSKSRTKKVGSRSCPPEEEAPERRRKLFEFFRDHRELQLGLGKGLHDQAFGQFGGGVLGGSHSLTSKCQASIYDTRGIAILSE